jgi:predicted nuclease of predicted toxin-antitoxin system
MDRSMRVLLDTCVPKRLARDLHGFEVRHATEMGWGDLDDGPLLTAMAGSFDALVTVDRNLPHQQNLNARPFAVLLLRAHSNRLTDLARLVPKLRAALKRAAPGQLIELEE